MPAMRDVKRKGRGNRTTYTEIARGLLVTYRLRYIGGQKSFKTLEGLREWLAPISKHKAFRKYDIEQIVVLTVERRDDGGEPYDVYRS